MYDQQGSYGAPYQSNPRSGTYGYQSNAAPPSSGYGQGYPAPNPEAGHTTGAGGPPPYGGYAAGGYAGDAGFGYGHQDAPYGRGTLLDAPTPRGGGWVGRRPSSSGSGEGHNGYKANYGRDAPRFGAVRLRGLPFGVRENEIAIFLGLDPFDIVLCQRHGRPSGEAIVVLSHPSELDAAMRRNRNYMGSRYIEVFDARKTDYYNAIYDVVSANDEGSFGALGGRGGGAGRWGPYGAQGSPREGRERRYSDGGGRDRSRSPVGGKDGGPLSTSIVKLRGLPFSAKEEEIVEFFADEELELTAFPTLEDVVLATTPEGRPSGMAFVEFATPADATRALAKDKANMGSRYIELFLATQDDRARWLPAH